MHRILSNSVLCWATQVTRSIFLWSPYHTFLFKAMRCRGRIHLLDCIILNRILGCRTLLRQGFYQQLLIASTFSSLLYDKNRILSRFGCRALLRQQVYQQLLKARLRMKSTLPPSSPRAYDTHTRSRKFTSSYLKLDFV